jgi:hypothetical protein
MTIKKIKRTRNDGVHGVLLMPYTAFAHTVILTFAFGKRQDIFLSVAFHKAVKMVA